MRFIYIGAFRFPTGDAAASRVLNNIRVMKELGHDVEVLSFGGKYTAKWEKYDDIPYFVTEDIDTHSWKERLTRYIYPYSNARKLLCGLTEGVDAIICYNPNLPFIWWLRLLCKRRHIKLIADITEWYSANEMLGGRFFPIYWMNEYNMRFTQKKIFNKILISNYLSDYYIKGNNIVVPPLCNPADEKWKKQLANSDIPDFSGITFIYAGTPAKKDCVHNALNAVNRILNEGANARFLLLGTTKEKYIEQFSHLLENQELHQNILFLGRKPQENIPAYYKLSDFMLLFRIPDRKSMAGFPTKVAESITSGVPVITNSTSDLNIFISDGKNGFIVDDYSTDAIYETLKNKVAMLSRSQIDIMKHQCLQMSESFNFQSYKNLFRVFINNLK